MTIHRPILIYLLLTLLDVITASDIGNTLLKFKKNAIRGIDLFGLNTIGVVLDTEVYVGKFQDDAFIKIGRILLNEQVYADAGGASSLLEFKLINESTALTCTSGGCSVCSLSADSLIHCYDIPLSPNRGKLSSVSATLVNHDIVLRTVHDKTDAAIQYLFPTHGFNFYVNGRQSVDAHSFNEIETVAGFSTPTHSYFIGSAKRLDLSLSSFSHQYKRNNNDIRITQICNSDDTTNLASRIDLVLSCEGINYKLISQAVSNRATAALYLPKSSKILVAFQHYVLASRTTENYICGYDFIEIQSRFTKTWDKCQSIPKPELAQNNCQKQTEYTKLTEDCFLFSWDNHMNPPYCSAYNGEKGINRFDNCKLHTIKNTSSAYGSLENFKPYDGKLLFKENHAQPIVAVRETLNEGTLYALRKDNDLIRILIGGNETSNVLTSIPASSGKDLLQVLPNSNKVLFVPAHSNNTINVIESSCEGIYKTCQNIAWNDPLNCLYCANEDGSGTVVSDKMACSNNNIIYRNVCPPTILEVTETANNTYLITGIDLNKFMEDPEVTVCDSRCNLTFAVEPTSIRCSTGINSTENCVVKIKGSLNLNYKNITLLKQLKDSNIETNIRKTVISVTASGGFVVLICIFVSRRRATKLKKKYSHDYSHILTDIQHNSMTDQLNPNDLVVLKTQPLGSGVSATVYKGSFNTSDSDNEPVAVKIFRNEYTLLINTAELIDELKVLRRVHHQNIVAFIGHTYIDHTLHIVTEYMAGGSLYDYIRAESTVLKYQHTFDYMDQILNAMVYLTHQHIVHRDLAARNCLVNADRTVVKVSDFGLARSVDFNGEYHILHDDIALPTRWIAIEAFSQHKFTEKSDVWSFGVLVWELLTRGNTPYFPLNHFQIQEYLNDGQRLQRPETCPDQIYAVIITCWDTEPRKRPTFEQLQKKMKRTITCLIDANKQMTESGYERPNSQPLTNVRSRAMTPVST